MKARSTLLMGLFFVLFATAVWYLEFSGDALESAASVDEDEAPKVPLLVGFEWERLRYIELRTEAQGGTSLKQLSVTSTRVCVPSAST